MRKTKVVATIGPTSIEKLDELSPIVDVFRMNLAHGDEVQHKEYYRKIREYAPEKPILMDLPGPKLRLGDIEKTQVNPGDTITFGIGGIPVSDPIFFKLVSAGQRILIADGLIETIAIDVSQNKVEAKVINGGILSARKGINLPDSNVPAGLTPEDLKLLEMAAELGADMIGLSFVTRPDEILQVKQKAKEAWVISKIEKKSAIDRLEEIVRVSDGVMVARGDLGIEVGLESLPVLQKKIIEVSRNYGKPVILATQVLESMVYNPLPTRAEVIDISNSVAQGVDAIMLSDETAAGNYPLEAVKYLDKVIESSEVYLNPVRVEPRTSDDAMALAAVDASELAGADLIIAYGDNEEIVLRISRLRPKLPILAIVPDISLARKLNLCYGVISTVKKRLNDMNSIIREINESAKIITEKGKTIILIGSSPEEKEGVNFLKIHKVN
ncbi:pyruvate kinase [Sulfolobales archaeon HS-7]|nr:pyruvate kinase [Sulfolobales archaeon HS-7]